MNLMRWVLICKSLWQNKSASLNMSPQKSCIHWGFLTEMWIQDCNFRASSRLAKRPKLWSAILEWGWMGRCSSAQICLAVLGYASRGPLSPLCSLKLMGGGGGEFWSCLHFNEQLPNLHFWIQYMNWKAIILWNFAHLWILQTSFSIKECVQECICKGEGGIEMHMFVKIIISKIHYSRRKCMSKYMS